MPDQITLTCTRGQMTAIRRLVDMRKMDESHKATRPDMDAYNRAHWENRSEQWGDLLDIIDLAIAKGKSPWL